MALQYPLLFPYGEDCWSNTIPYREDRKRQKKRDSISIREFYLYRLHERYHEAKTLLFYSGRLFQQYVVDSYAAIETERLQWVKQNQKSLRVELFRGLQDAITTGETIAGAIGKRYILPSSFYGGPRHMYQNYQDAMAICRVVGFPDFFITFTCNPNWNEIRSSLGRNQRVEDRPDIVAHVFHIKMKQFLKNIKNQMFIKVLAGKPYYCQQLFSLCHIHKFISNIFLQT
ncbi:hypothetical protein J5N97_017691 [Dioscorea zingiberensis]|uniref:Helitron helicase-like domain-containing protein n=1 Tax=Dioscorea zingiberensis TaxID=325984 RepID=A0A9D5CLX4_9LILI|nr:hypothetical protein J5N97_017691 [Dioscorea zingiberensis]